MFSMVCCLVGSMWTMRKKTRCHFAYKDCFVRCFVCPAGVSVLHLECFVDVVRKQKNFVKLSFTSPEVRVRHHTLVHTTSALRHNEVTIKLLSNFQCL